MDAPSQKSFQTLEGLLELPAAELEVTLSRACDVVAGAFGADKVDAFLHDASRESMVALGTSHQPLSALQKKLGLDVLPVANGGRVVWVFERGETFVTGAAQDDAEELRGIREALRVRSQLGVPLDVGGARRGVLMVASLQPDYFSAEDVRLAEAVVRWVGVVAHRAELVQEIARDAVKQGRRAVAEELITILAHDLRNHLSPITARLSLIRSRAEQQGRGADLRDADLARRAVDRINALVADILDVARIDQGFFALDRQPLDLRRVLEDVARTLATPQHPVLVQVSEEVVAAADEARLRQCLENLVANALKHSPAGAPVAVSLRKEGHEGGERARIDVVDEGPGVPEHLRPRIFDRFVTDGSRHGLGLGLYLARRIAEAHGGELTVDSAAGTGARFTLLLPTGLDREPPQAPPAAEAQ